MSELPQKFVDEITAAAVTGIADAVHELTAGGPGSGRHPLNPRPLNKENYEYFEGTHSNHLLKRSLTINIGKNDFGRNQRVPVIPVEGNRTLGTLDNEIKDKEKAEKIAEALRSLPGFENATVIEGVSGRYGIAWGDKDKVAQVSSKFKEQDHEWLGRAFGYPEEHIQYWVKTHPKIKASNLPQKFVDEITAAAVTGIADAVHELTAGGPGSGRHPGFGKGLLPDVGKETKISKILHTISKPPKALDNINSDPASGKLTKIPLDKIIAPTEFQDTIYNKTVNNYVRNPKWKNPDPDVPKGAPRVKLYKGMYYVHDGNHRAAAAVLRGDSHLKAIVLNKKEDKVKYLPLTEEDLKDLEASCETYPEDHKVGMHVPKGGSSCAVCHYLKGPHECGEENFIRWNKGPYFSPPADEYCCDYFIAAKKIKSAKEDNGWHGVDLDSTIAYYDEYISDTHIGKPLDGEQGEALAQVKEWLANGETVKIFTARASKPAAVKAIKEWCKKHLGQELEVTDRKDPDMIDLLDDRVHRVEENTGKILAYGTTEGAIKGWDTRGRKESDKLVSEWKQGKSTHEVLNGIPFKIKTNPDYSKLVNSEVKAPPFPKLPTFEAEDKHGQTHLYQKHAAAGMVIKESDGRIWMVSPANHYGGYVNTFPKGTANKEEDLQETAVREVHEESGLLAKITDYLGDAEGDTSVTRYYLGERVGGAPWDTDKETESVKLVPVDKHLKDRLLNVFGETTRDHKVLDMLLSKLNIKAESLWHSISIEGFSRPEEEAIGAMLSRIPPELLTNVEVIQSAKELNAKHGKYIAEEKKILFNPKNLLLRQRFGKGDGWISHAELCIVHEVGHSLYDALPLEEQLQWQALSGWMKGTKEGQAPPYEERRPGWEHKTSEWTHKFGVKFPRYYAERNPGEDFADCFAFFMQNKAHQIGDTKRDYFEEYIKQHVKRYPQASIQSPVDSIVAAAVTGIADAIHEVFGGNNERSHDSVQAQRETICVQQKHEENIGSSGSESSKHERISELWGGSRQEEIEAYGTSEGVTKSWDTRGRGRKEYEHHPREHVANEDTVLGKKIAESSGTNPGGVYEGKDGVKRYVKFYKNSSQAYCESLANSIYRDLGLNAPKSITFKHEGNIAVANELLSGKELNKVPLTKDLANNILKGFAADILTANWDAVGLEHDNVLVHNNEISRIDNGGSFLYRAQKSNLKPENLLNQITEVTGLLNPGINPAYAKVAAVAGVKSYQDIPDFKAQVQKIMDLENSVGWNKYIKQIAPDLDDASRNKINDMLYARSQALEKLAKQMEEKPVSKSVSKPEEEEQDKPKKAKAPKGSVQLETFQKYQSGEYKTKKLYGLFPPYGARATMYKELMTGEWKSKSSFLGKTKLDSLEKIDSTFGKLKSAGKTIGLWTMEKRVNPKTGDIEFKLTMALAHDQAKGQVGITEDVHHKALQAIQKMISNTGLDTTISKQAMDDYLSSVGVKNVSLLSKCVGSWTGSAQSTEATYLKKIASDYYGNDWSKEFANHGITNSHFKYDDLKKQALAIKALSNEYIKASGLNTMYRGLHGLDSSILSPIKEAVAAGKAVPIPLNSLSGYSVKLSTAAGSFGHDVVIRTTVKPEEVWVASGALPHLFGSFAHGEKEYLVGHSKGQSKVVYLDPKDVWVRGTSDPPDWVIEHYKQQYGDKFDKSKIH